MKAIDLLSYLLELQSKGHDLHEITINYRNDYDSDVSVCNFVDEDLFDEETNNILKSIVLITGQ